MNRLPGRGLWIVAAGWLLVACAAAPEPAGSAGRVDFLRSQLADGDGRYVMVTAHRGAHGAAPENSVAAIERAIGLGADIVEIDVRLTRDGVPVLMHDETVDRTTDGTGAVSAMGFEEVARLALRDRAGASTPHRVPTLREALEAARGRILVDLDLKTRDVEPIASRVVEADAAAGVLFFHGDFDQLDRFRAIRADFAVLPRANSTERTEAAAARFAPEVIHIDPGSNSAATGAAARAADARLWINALGEGDELIRRGEAADAVEPLLAHGANIIQTDEPAALIAYLQRTGRR